MHQKHTKSISKSIFHELPGMGEKRVQKLLSTYSDVKTIAGLNPDQIQNDLGFPKSIAEAIVAKAKEG